MEELQRLPIVADYYLPKVAATFSMVGSSIVLLEVLHDHKLAWQRRTRTRRTSRTSTSRTSNGGGSSTQRRQQPHQRHLHNGGASTISRILVSMSIGDILFSL